MDTSVNTLRAGSRIRSARGLAALAVALAAIGTAAARPPARQTNREPVAQR